MAGVLVVSVPGSAGAQSKSLSTRPLIPGVAARASRTLPALPVSAALAAPRTHAALAAETAAPQTWDISQEVRESDMARQMQARLSQVNTAVTRIEISRIEPAFEGARFGEVGVYEKIVGRYWAELDPSNPRNAVITDLDKAPRNANGKVEYSADFYILTPKDAAKGNGSLLYEIGNRGNKSTLWMMNFSPLPPGQNDPSTLAQAGDGFLMRHGYTMVWSGVYGDVARGGDAHTLTIQVPIARNADGSPIEETIWDESTNSQEPTGKARFALSYPVPNMDQSQATLLVRERRSDAPVEISREQWAFDGPGAIRLLPEGRVFEPGFIYQFIHKAANPPVMGIGLAAIRDFLSFLRDAPQDEVGKPGPLPGRIRTVLLMGWSQSGRMAREFLYRGFNEAEREPGKKVLDGVLVFGAATRPFVNFRFAQPLRAPDKQQSTLHFPDSGFPFAYDVQTDPLTGRTDGILHGCLETGTCPKVVHLVTSNEFWHYKQSPVTTNTLGTRDARLSKNVRAYSLAGLAHAPYATTTRGIAEQPHNEIRYTYLLRAILTRLNDWASLGASPPPSNIPKIADRTLVAVREVRWPKIPGVTFAGPVLTRHPIINYGPEFARGIIRKVLPREEPLEYPPLVPQVDRDGNDIAGIKHPAVSVPLATRTGWSVRVHPNGRGSLISQDGAAIPFPRTKRERLASNDPRASIAERYRGLRHYMVLVRREARRLVRQGFLLSEDVERIVDQAVAEWRDRHLH